jgi:hypothetical protein
MKTVDSHRQCLEPLLDVVPFSVVELTAQFMLNALVKHIVGEDSPN